MARKFTHKKQFKQEFRIELLSLYFRCIYFAFWKSIDTATVSLRQRTLCRPVRQICERNLKIRVLVMLVTLDLLAIFYTKYADISMKFHPTKYQVSGLTNSLDIAKRKRKKIVPRLSSFYFAL